MGISKNQAKWLKLITEKYDIDFTDTLTLGRLFLYISKEEANAELKEYFNINNIFQDDGYSEKFFSELSSKKINKIESVDYSDYEGATLVWDMNNPIGTDFRERYSVVIDGGTLEHIYNFPQALKNAMESVRIGGHLILMSPINNWIGHGFYQLSPEIYWSVLNENNGFRILQMNLEEANVNPKRTFRRINKTEIKGLRKTIRTYEPSQIFLVAKKISVTPEKIIVQQSDYEVSWEKNNDKGLVSWEKVQKDLMGGQNKGSKIRKFLGKIKPVAYVYRLYFWIRKIDKNADYIDIDGEIKNICRLTQKKQRKNYSKIVE